MRYVNPNCAYCGKFVSWTADQATYYGSSQDTEPPDPHYFCSGCAEKRKQEAIKTGVLYSAYWCKPKWWLEAKEILESQNDKS